MPRLDPADIQVLILEMQPEITRSVTTVTEASLLKATGILRRLCDTLSIPITASGVPMGPGNVRLVDELDGLQPLVRSTVSPFADEDISGLIAGRDRKILTIAGVSSEIAIHHAALDALENGYDVHLLVDACGGLGERTEAAAMRRLEAAGAHPSSISSFFTGMVGDMSDDTGAAVMELMAKLWSWGRDDA